MTAAVLSTTSRARIERDPDRARAAHLLRRATLTVDPDRIERFGDLDWDGGVAAVLDEAQEVPTAEPPRTDDWGDIVQWWLERMTSPESGLRDRMTWFWHTLLTTNAHQVSEANLIGDQLVGLRSGCLGDYRSLLNNYITGGALLEFLDASWSLASNPNENLARELMELFTLGPGHYTQDDVRSAARALAGWVVEDGKVEWRRENAFLAPLLFRGVQDEWDTTKVVDHLCDQPETAVNVSRRLWAHLVGSPLGDEAAVELGNWWHERDLAITDLVERILTDQTMVDSRYSRPRSGLEWHVAFLTATGLDPDDYWSLESLGQMPYLPPSVGGWRQGERWLSPGSLLTRARMAFNLDFEQIADGRSGTSDEILDRCGLQEVSPSTLAAIEGIRSGDTVPAELAHRTRWRLALVSPEFNLS